MQRLLVAVDASGVAPLVVSRAVDMAKRMGAKIRLFHAVSLPEVAPPPGNFVPRVTDALVTAARQAVGELERAIPPELRDGTTLTLGAPADAIVQAAREFDVDLVVIGAHDHRRLDRIFGTTANHVVDRLDRPVLVVRPVCRHDVGDGRSARAAPLPRGPSRGG